MFTSESEKGSNSQFGAANELAGEGHNPDYKGYYQKTAAARAALTEGDTLEVNVNVPSAVRVASRALPRILSLRDQMQGLPVDLAAIDGVGVFAGALAYVHACYTVEAAPPRAMQALYVHLLRTRRLLRTDAVNLATRGLING